MERTIERTKESNEGRLLIAELGLQHLVDGPTREIALFEEARVAFEESEDVFVSQDGEGLPVLDLSPRFTGA